MTKLTQRQINAFATRTTEQLQAAFDNIEHTPQAYRKDIAGGRRYLLQSWVKYGDRILAEISRRKGN